MTTIHGAQVADVLLSFQASTKFAIQAYLKKMRAVQFYDKEDIRLNENIDIPVALEGQVRIKPAFVGICGSGPAPMIPHHR